MFPSHFLISLVSITVGFALASIDAPESVAADSPPVPKTLYHFGVAQILERDIQLGMVPVTDWNQFILGNQTRFGQKPYRRGLYGTEHPGYSSYYGDRLIETGRMPGLMRIQITPDCQNERPYDLMKLYEDDRFIQYITENPAFEFATPESFHARCYHWDEDRQIETTELEMVTGLTPENHCERFVSRMFQTLKPKIIRDHLVRGSFFIRERSCIETIDGTPEQILKMMTEIPGFWNERPDGQNPRVANVASNRSLLFILLQSLSRADSVGLETVDQLATLVQATDLKNPAAFWSPGREKWMAATLGWILLDYRQCLSGGKIAQWKQTAQIKVEAWARYTTSLELERAIDLARQQSFCLASEPSEIR